MQGQFIRESAEGLAFADQYFCEIFKIVAQMLNPYRLTSQIHITNYQLPITHHQLP